MTTITIYLWQIIALAGVILLGAIGIGILTGMAQRLQVEQSLRASEARNRAILMAIPDMITLYRRDGTFLDIIQTSSLISPIQDPNPVGKHISELLPVEVAERQLAAMQRTLATHEPQVYEQEVWGQGKLQYEEIRVIPCGEDAVLIIVRDISDRHQLDRIKDEFISIVSHELRTPLTAIRGSLGILDAGVLSNEPETSRHMLRVALNNSERLVRLVNDILDLERLESGKVNLVMQSCEVNDLIQQAVESVQAIATGSFIRIAWAPVSAQVWAAPDAIVQTLTNLLGNAIKFSPEGSTIWLRAERESEAWGNENGEVKIEADGKQAAEELALVISHASVSHASPIAPRPEGRSLQEGKQDGPHRMLNSPVPNPEPQAHQLTKDRGHRPLANPKFSYILFSIKDQGRGIPAEKLEYIFDRFQQVDVFDSRQKGGTGLGLAICKSIVHQHGGQIWVESSPGQGSTFYFTLPLLHAQETG
ncbi:sensor histidine kinase [Leptodesmis sichuanensis]|uniref:sensor histidine kinase n=1 Tax=Leptodesmis sichuanensis TaxID=2906798 RepID=UPI001F22650D|nr:ATP-binding protein [Leptodesmis sichuanensis]UIE36651.1 PAS domain-containing protein [Leptodesmis sichuanensis A121]